MVLGGTVCQGWWLVEEGEGAGPDRIVAGPFPDRADAVWSAGTREHGSPEVLRPVHGSRRPDGSLARRPSPQEWAWLAHLGGQLDRLPEDWDAELADDDPLVTLVVEVAAALVEAGLPLHDATGIDRAVGGACLTIEPALGGIVVAWRQHDRMSIDQVHGSPADALVQHAMNRALADVLLVRGFAVDAFGGAGGSVVRGFA